MLSDCIIAGFCVIFWSTMLLFAVRGFAGSVVDYFRAWKGLLNGF